MSDVKDTLKAIVDRDAENMGYVVALSALGIIEAIEGGRKASRDDLAEQVWIDMARREINPSVLADWLSKSAYRLADAMLKARKERRDEKQFPDRKPERT